MIAILGAGLAGLTAAFELLQRGVPGREIIIFEKEADVGGLAQTMSREGFSFDLGPHRWFTKSGELDRLWEEINCPDILQLDRLTRIWYRKRLLNYPLAPLNILRELGFAESTTAIGSYLMQALRNRFTHSPPQSLEEAFIRQFGPALYNAFFREYNLKLWGGGGCGDLAPDWARQRVKGLSLGRALLDALDLTPKGKVVSLVEKFKSPYHGTGQTASRLAEQVASAGGTILRSTAVTGIEHKGNCISRIIADRAGHEEAYETDYCISSIPIDLLTRSLRPVLPGDAAAAASGLRYRALVFIVLFLNAPRVMRDNWIYVQDPTVTFNRFMDMGSWNSALSPPGMTSLVFEVTCNYGDALWSCSDDQWIERIGAEFVREFGFVEKSRIIGGTVVRKTHAYPVYALDYKRRLEAVKQGLGGIENLQLIGRNGLFRYNNMDHSMATGIAAARNYLGESLDIESINFDQEYHEEKRES